jgi:glycolate dehydrogenase iron-sulfur subunit
MQTTFSPQQLEDAATARSNAILRTCIHCGFCTATCPTYQILGDELDGPRGRIYLIKDMLENHRVPDAKTVLHIDRCLSCLACMTTCPSGVHYMHLVDHAREYIEARYRRPLMERAIREMLARVLPYPSIFRLAITGAKIVRPVAPILPKSLRAMIKFAPKKLPAPSPNDKPQTFAADTPRRKRVVLMTGCAQRVLNTDINDATIRLLTRHGCEVIIPKAMGCCGALTHHMGKTKQSHGFAARNITAWAKEMDGDGLDAIIINTSGCGTTVKDYGHMFKGDPLEKDATRVAAIARDITEFMAGLTLEKSGHAPALKVAYHAACSLQHGQQIRTEPKSLLRAAGFKVVEPNEQHLCCGSAGTYNLMQPEISAKLRDRKLANLKATKSQVIAAGNIGCMMQIGAAAGVPIVHSVELLDWATGGPVPPAIAAADIDLEVKSAPRPTKTIPAETVAP